MKSIKLLFISLLILPLLTNCGDDDKKKASTPVPYDHFGCRTDDYQCRNNAYYNQGNNQFFQNQNYERIMTGKMQVVNNEVYKQLLEHRFGCDSPRVFFDGSWQSALGSVLATSANRCSKANAPGQIDLYYYGNSRVNVQIFAGFDYSGLLPLHYMPNAIFEVAEQESVHFINLESANQGRNGLVLMSEGDIYGPNFTLSLVLNGEVITRTRMYEYVQQQNQYQQY